MCILFTGGDFGVVTNISQLVRGAVLINIMFAESSRM